MFEGRFAHGVQSLLRGLQSTFEIGPALSAKRRGVQLFWDTFEKRVGTILGLRVFGNCLGRPFGTGMGCQFMGMCMGTILGKLWETQLLGYVLGHVWDVSPLQLWDLEFMGKCEGTPGMPLGRVWDISLSTSVTCSSYALGED